MQVFFVFDEFGRGDSTVESGGPVNGVGRDPEGVVFD